MIPDTRNKEKRAVALTSVLAAVALTVFKLLVGLLTNSLGILAEAAHSGLDLVAAVMTYFAVRVADRPADAGHPFGHGKVENLSALFETLLLLGTSGWIVYEAVNRLFFHPAEVESSPWSFLVMGASIVIDVNRSRMLGRAARKYNSQALEADALHFSTDIWSSAVVLAGLAGVSAAGLLPGLPWLGKMDAIAAAVVAVIVLVVSARLGGRTIAALLDSAPPGLAERLQAAARAVPGVQAVHAVRLRPSGAGWFVDLHVGMDENLHLRTGHAASEAVERAVQELLPSADVTVHVEPVESPGKTRSGSQA